MVEEINLEGCPACHEPFSPSSRYIVRVYCKKCNKEFDTNGNEKPKAQGHSPVIPKINLNISTLDLLIAERFAKLAFVSKKDEHHIADSFKNIRNDPEQVFRMVLAQVFNEQENIKSHLVGFFLAITVLAAAVHDRENLDKYFSACEASKE